MCTFRGSVVEDKLRFFCYGMSAGLIIASVAVHLISWQYEKAAKWLVGKIRELQVKEKSG